MDSFVAFDTETTGFGRGARAVEIAVVRFENGRLTKAWETLVRPQPVNWTDPGVLAALRVNQVPVRDVMRAPSFASVLPRFLLELKCPIWVAHHPRYDLRVLQYERTLADRASGCSTSRLVPRPRVILDTVSLDYALAPNAEGSRNLAAVASRWGVTQTNAHRARGDATTCGRILCRMEHLLPKDLGELAAFQKDAARRWESARAKRPATKGK